MEKVGIRLDFVLMALSRLVPELERERQMLRITADREVGPGEVGEERCSFYPDFLQENAAVFLNK